MRKFIVTTTINPPTEALKKFASMTDWVMIIVGDKKTPHSDYYKLEDKYPNVFYFHPSDQYLRFPKLSDLIGWNCIQRRNLGLVLAYLEGADVIATVDDDNIPYDFWGKDLLVGKKVLAHYYKTTQPVFDPLTVTNRNKLWHRGFPIELVRKKNASTKKRRFRKRIKVLVQADLWDGGADVDAIERISLKTDVTLKTKTPYSANKISPFNSQNTFLAREVIPDYFLFPHIGRLDDIWASYWLQHKHGNCVVYNKPSVLQKRNVHSLIEDMKKEMIGYEHSLEFVEALPNIKKFLPKRSWEAFKEYRRLLK